MATDYRSDDDEQATIRAEFVFAQVPEAVVYSQLLSDRAVRLYCALARFADKEHRAWPGYRLLGERLYRSRDSIARAMGELRETGAVSVTPRFVGGRQVSNDYVLHADVPGVPRESAGARDSKDAGGNATANLRGQGTITSVEREPEERTARAVSIGAEFDAFWSAYPNKIAKPAGRRAFAKALKSAEFDTIMAGVANWSRYWVARSAPEFVPHPATWLNQERWNDMPPRVAPKSSMARLNAVLADEQQQQKFITTTATEESDDTQRDERSDPHSGRVLRGATPTTEVG